MNLEDLMEVWRSQDAVPLHGVNETLLRLALRQDEAKFQAARRRMKVLNNLGMAVLVGMTAFCLLILTTPQVDDVSGGDYVVGIVGLAASVALWRTIYVAYRAEARREERFGESLRDQLNRQLAMIDSVLSFSWRNWTNVAMIMLGFGAAIALSVLLARINGAPYEEVWPGVRGAILYSLIGMGIVGWWLRRWVRRDLAPRKRRLQALLKELDA